MQDLPKIMDSLSFTFVKGWICKGLEFFHFWFTECKFSVSKNRLLLPFFVTFSSFPSPRFLSPLWVSGHLLPQKALKCFDTFGAKALCCSFMFRPVLIYIYIYSSKVPISIYLFHITKRFTYFHSLLKIQLRY